MAQVETVSTDLPERIRKGDEHAEAELYRRYGAGVKQILSRATGNFALAEELCQETLIIVLKRLRAEPLNDPSRLGAFIAQTARNLAMAEHRKKRRRQTDTGTDELAQAVDETLGQEGQAQLRSASAAVRAVLKELKSARDRLLLVRYYLRDEDKERICHDLGLSEQTFNVILFRARNRFLELLQKKGIGKSDLFCVALA